MWNKRDESELVFVLPSYIHRRSEAEWSMELPTPRHHPRAVNLLIYSRSFLEFCQPRPQSALYYYLHSFSDSVDLTVHSILSCHCSFLPLGTSIPQPIESRVPRPETSVSTRRSLSPPFCTSADCFHPASENRKLCRHRAKYPN